EDRTYEKVSDESVEGHTPRGFSGRGTGLFSADTLNSDFPEGDGVQAFTTLGLTAGSGIADATGVESATLTIPDSRLTGTPFVDLGALVAEEIFYDAFSPDLFDKLGPLAAFRPPWPHPPMRRRRAMPPSWWRVPLTGARPAFSYVSGSRPPTTTTAKATSSSSIPTMQTRLWRAWSCWTQPS
ncbi:MAG: hypothetical protein ACJATT_004965, partial [Myxococcota bacterium]